MTLEEALRQFLASDKRAGQYVAGAAESALAAQQMSDSAVRCAITALRSSGAPIDGIDVYADPPINEGDKVVIHIHYNHEQALRDGFSDADYQAKYGTRPDLLYLLNNGWSYDKKPPRGMWHDHMTTALQEREGYHFVQDAAEMIKRELGDSVVVQIDERYQSGNSVE